MLIAGGGKNAEAREGPSTLFNPGTKVFALVDGPEIGMDHRAVRLEDGRVFIFGGMEPGELRPSAKIWVFDPQTGRVVLKGTMRQARAGHTATLLPDGKILMAGGISKGIGKGILASGELYDPVTGMSGLTGKLKRARTGHAAVLLPTGRVMVLGGWTLDKDGNRIFPGEIEMYDPDTGTWGIQDTQPYGVEDPILFIQYSGNTFVSGTIQSSK